jgi:hypothetical protein
MNLFRATKLHFAILAFTVLFLLVAYTADVWNLSAQEATGGNGAGLSEYQE